MSNFVIICPHCDENIVIEKINCAIFRHAVIKTTREQLNPHSSKEICDDHILKNSIFGCGKPFKVIKNPKYIANKNNAIDTEEIEKKKEEEEIEEEEYIAIICDYI
jgi:hypothetical protein